MGALLDGGRLLRGRLAVVDGEAALLQRLLDLLGAPVGEGQVWGVSDGAPVWGHLLRLGTHSSRVFLTSNSNPSFSRVLGPLTFLLVVVVLLEAQGYRGHQVSGCTRRVVLLLIPAHRLGIVVGRCGRC